MEAIWLNNLFDYLHTHPEIARNGFHKAGLLTCTMDNVPGTVWLAGGHYIILISNSINAIK